MKKTIFIFLSIFFLTFCAVPEEERQLKERFDKLEELAQTSEAKENIKNMYKKALEELRESKKEKEELSKISYNEKEDITDQLFKFCDELWEDQNYNPAKYEVKCKEFKFKSVSFDGGVSYIVSKDGDNYLALYYKTATIEINEFSKKSRDIIFLINTDTPEQIMEFKKGDKITVKGILAMFHKSENYDGQTYFFNIYNPIISKKSETEAADKNVSEEDKERKVAALNNLQFLSEKESSDISLIFRIQNNKEENSALAVPFAIFTSNKYFEVPFLYDETSIPSLSEIDQKIYKSNNSLSRKFIKPLVDKGNIIASILNGKQISTLTSSALTTNGLSDWQTYSAGISDAKNIKVGASNLNLGKEPLSEISPPELKKKWGDGDDQHTRELLDFLDIDGDKIPEYIYEVSDYEGVHYEIWSYQDQKWVLVFKGGYYGL